MRRIFPRWTRHALFGVLGFALLLGLFQWDVMHELDAAVGTRLQGGNAPFNKEIVLVDMPMGIGTPEIVRFRARLGAWLQAVAKAPANLPRVVGLDIWFAADVPGHDVVQAGIADLQAQGVLVIGAVNIDKENSDGFDPDYDQRHLMRLYSHMDGVGHNALNKPRGNEAWAFYIPCPAGHWPMAMAVLLARRQDLCEQALGTERRVPLGPHLLRSLPHQVLGYDQSCEHGLRRYGSDCLTRPPDLRHRIVLIGSFAQDRSLYTGRPGPEIVAWATSDLLSVRGGTATRGLLNDAVLQLSLALLTAAAALLAFFGLLRTIRRWRVDAWRIAMLAAAVAVLVPLGLIGLARMLGHDFSQVLLPLLTMLLSLALAVHHHQGARLAAERARDALPDLHFAAYDVFVSYRHSHREWVEGTLRPMLESMQRVDGSALSLFFDSDGIHSGNNWATRLGRVIHESRVFLALLTPDYFEPNAQGRTVCKWEMEQALQLDAQSEMVIVPLYHDGYDPERDTSVDLPHLGAIHGRFTSAPDWADKTRSRILDALDKAV